jgi:peptide/nickel transport system permease protein
MHRASDSLGRVSRRASLALWGSLFVTLLLVASVGAPLLAPYDPSEQIDPAAARKLPPGSALWVIRLEDGRTIAAETVERQGGELRYQRLGKTHTLPLEQVRNRGPQGVTERRLFLLGSDRFGRDLLSRILYGARLSLAISLSAVLLALSLGMVVGALAAIGGPIVDSILMRTVDAFLAFPRLFLLLALAGLFPPGILLVVIILGITSWMTISRVVRGEILSLAQREFVVAARAVGVPPIRILLRHLLPNAWTPVIVQAALLVGDFILVEAALSFLGLGVEPGTASWGSMVNEGRSEMTSAWWIATFPGLSLALTVISFNVLADGVRDILDPRRSVSSPLP